MGTTKPDSAQRGQPPPYAPARGMKLWVQWGSHLAMGNGYSINKVNSRSFYVSTDGRQERYLLVEWEQWLDRRFAEGKVLLEGELLEPPPQALPIRGRPRARLPGAWIGWSVTGCSSQPLGR